MPVNPTARGERYDLRSLRTRVWDQVCRHVDGLAVGSTVAALDESGLLRIIAAAEQVSVGELRQRTNVNPGYLHVAIRLLADQAWVVGGGEPGTDALTVRPTRCGRAVMAELAGGYRTAVGFLPMAERLDPVLSGRRDPEARDTLAHFHELMRQEWRLPPDTLPVRARRQVLAHLDGHLVAPVMSSLTRRGVLRRGTAVPLNGGSRDALRSAFGILASQGWVRITEDTARLTPAGVVAAAFGKQYWHPVSYVPTFRRVPRLLFGDPGTGRAGPDDGDGHLDRELDIRFSGEVFTATCRAPFLEMTLPLFDRRPVEVQPAAVVDVGCGDGTVLETLYAHVRANTERGRRLADRPLVMVGVEPSPVARRVTAERLRRADIPHVVVDGDIADPGGIARAMREGGLDPADALYVSKSVIHDRAYREPGERVPVADPPPVSWDAFAAPDGSVIPPAKMALSLVELFRAWREPARRHGLLVIEAHAADPGTSSRFIGRTVATSFDATHGYSNQYPVEPDVFAWAARAAGLRSRAHREPGAETTGHTVLTVDHLVADDR
jgi:hypothetical protein